MQVDLNPVDPNIAPLAEATYSGLVQSFIQGLFIVAAFASFIYLLLGGYRWISSGGDKEGIAKASRTISHALIGLIITFSVFSITGILARMTNINLFCIEIPGIGVSLGSCPGLSYAVPDYPTPTQIPPQPSPGEEFPPGNFCLCGGTENYCSSYSGDEFHCQADPQCSCNFVDPGTSVCLCSGSTEQTQKSCSSYDFNELQCLSNKPPCDCIYAPISNLPTCQCTTLSSQPNTNDECSPLTTRSACLQNPSCFCQYPFWTITLRPTCSNGAKPSIFTRSMWTFWPNDLAAWHPSDFSQGSHTITIPQGTTYKAVWLGLENQDPAPIIPGSNNNWIKPISPLPINSDIQSVWNPPTWTLHLYQTGATATPRGSYTVYFDVPLEYCNLSYPTEPPTTNLIPTVVPSDTPIVSIPSATPVIPSATPVIPSTTPVTPSNTPAPCQCAIIPFAKDMNCSGSINRNECLSKANCYCLEDALPFP